MRDFKFQSVNFSSRLFPASCACVAFFERDVSTHTAERVFAEKRNYSFGTRLQITRDPPVANERQSNLDSVSGKSCRAINLNRTVSSTFPERAAKRSAATRS